MKMGCSTGPAQSESENGNGLFFIFNMFIFYLLYVNMLILYIPLNNFSVMSGWVQYTKLQIKCHAQGHKMDG